MSLNSEPKWADRITRSYMRRPWPPCPASAIPSCCLATLGFMLPGLTSVCLGTRLLPLLGKPSLLVAWEELLIFQNATLTLLQSLLWLTSTASLISSGIFCVLLGHPNITVFGGHCTYQVLYCIKKSEMALSIIISPWLHLSTQSNEQCPVGNQIKVINRRC